MKIGSKRNVLIVMGVVVLATVGFGLYAKADADAKAAQYQAARTEVSSVVEEVDSLKLSDYIGVYKDGRENVKAMRGICTAASRLAANIERSTLEPSVGSLLSSEYRAAEKAAVKGEEALRTLESSLQSYAKRCDYYTTSSESEVKVKDIKASPEYEQQITRGGTCEFDSCIRAGHHQKFAALWGRIHQLDAKREAYYREANCPLKEDQEKFCAQLVKSVAASADYSKKYVVAVKAENRSRINELARDKSVSRAIGELNKVAKQLDSGAADANAFYASVMKRHERELREVAKAFLESTKATEGVVHGE